jgi:hypothetical protein
MLEVIVMPKLQINITDDSSNILDSLIQKNTKSIFVDLAIKSFKETKQGRSFLSELESNKKSPKVEKKADSVPKKKSVGLKEWD